jgi:hypothetical protein
MHLVVLRNDFERWKTFRRELHRVMHGGTNDYDVAPMEKERAIKKLKALALQICPSESYLMSPEEPDFDVWRQLVEQNSINEGDSAA